ncbi:MAG: HipA N-terminal domain-containing protein [Maritimibacter sp.]
MTDASIILWGRRIGAVSWDEARGLGVFQYDPEFVGAGIELAPLKMPVREAPYEFPALRKETFKGLPGMLADALPDNAPSAKDSIPSTTPPIIPTMPTDLRIIPSVKTGLPSGLTTDNGEGDLQQNCQFCTLLSVGGFSIERRRSSPYADPSLRLSPWYLATFRYMQQNWQYCCRGVTVYDGRLIPPGYAAKFVWKMPSHSRLRCGSMTVSDAA